MSRFLLLVLVPGLAACTNFLFVPYRPIPVTPDMVGVRYEDISVAMHDGISLHGWKLLATGNKQGTILFFHGNGDNVSTQLPATSWFPEQGYDVYIIDYRGYGQSEGVAELENVIRDMETTIAYVVDRLPEDEKLIVIGHSLGASMAIYTVAHSAFKKRIRTLVSIDAFSDYHDVTRDVLSRSWLFWLFQWPLSYTVDNSYRPLDAIGKVSPVPVLIMHGKSDGMIDIYHARRLFEAANPTRKLQLIDSGHNNIFVNAGNRQVLLDYLSSLR